MFHFRFALQTTPQVHSGNWKSDEHMKYVLVGDKNWKCEGHCWISLPSTTLQSYALAEPLWPMAIGDVDPKRRPDGVSQTLTH